MAKAKARARDEAQENETRAYGPLPWNRAPVERLLALDAAGRLPHAFVLGGPQGTGKRSFADELARGLMCTGEGSRPCGACRECELNSAGSHPDALVLTFLEDKRSIGIEQMRELIDALGLTASRVQRQVVTVTPAEAMTRPAANAFLKTLEEPPGDVVFILVSSRPSRLLPTVRSRCQVLRVDLPDPAQAAAWLVQRGHEEQSAGRALGLASGAPLIAAGLLEDDGIARRDAVLSGLAALIGGRSLPLEVAANWQAIGGQWTLHWLASLVNDMARLALGAAPDALLHGDHRTALQECTSGLDSGRVMAMARAIADTARARAGHSGFNEPLMLEALALDLYRCVPVRTGG